MNANEIQRFDTIEIRRSNERKSRQGMVVSVHEDHFAGIDFVNALVDFGKTQEVVNLNNVKFQLIWRGSEVA